MVDNMATDQRLLTTAKELSDTRSTPPTIIGSLCRWQATPLLLIAAAIGTALIAYAAQMPHSPITSHWAVGFAAMMFGAALRDVGWTRRIVTAWPIHAQFIDWRKVDDLLGQVDSQDG